MKQHQYRLPVSTPATPGRTPARTLATACALALAGCWGALAPSTAGAAPLYYYGELGGGVSSIDVPCAGAACDTSGKGFKILGGYEFSRYFAFEAGYYMFGHAKHMVQQTVNGQTSVQQARVLSGGLAASAAGSWTLWDRLMLKGRLGLGYFTTQLSLDGTDGKGSDTKFHPLFGVGASYEVLPLLSVGLDYDFSKTPYLDGPIKTSLLSLTARYRF